MQTSRRAVGALLLSLLALTACGGDDGGGAVEETTTTEAPATGTRTVEGAYGEVEIPADPQRIMADLMTLDYLTALGYDTDKIVGVFDAGFFPDDHYLADELEGKEDPGFQAEPNIEQIAAMEPDLILLPFDQIDGAESFDELEAIAPMLVVPTSETRDPETRYGGTASFQDWRRTLRAYGDLLDREEDAEAYIAETEEQLAALRDEYGELIDETTATEMKSTPDYMAVNTLDSAAESGVLGTILLSELGFSTPDALAAVAPDEYGTIELSDENLDLVDSDLLFVEVREDATDHTDSPLWGTLPVVQAGGVVEVGNHWEYGGAVAARVVLEDIRSALEGLAERQ